MSWGLGWKRPSEIFHLTLEYGADDISDDQRDSSSSSSSSLSREENDIGFKIDLQWSVGEDEEQIALRLQSQLMVALPAPQDTVSLQMRPEEDNVGVDMKVVKQREPLKAVVMSKTIGSGQQSDGVGVLTRLMKPNFTLLSTNIVEGIPGMSEHWKNVTVLSLCGCGMSVLPVELTRLPLLQKMFLDNNKLSLLPPELGELKNLKVLRVVNNMLISVPAELRQCVGLVELSLEHNKLIRPLLDFRAMAELCTLRLFGNPLEFLPEILPLSKLRHLSLANIKIAADEHLRSVNVQIEMENSSYFVASRHKLSAFFSLIFRFSSCHHPLLASALAKMMQDEGNRMVVGRDENAMRQLISMINSDNRHVVEQACSALSSLAADVAVAMQLIKSDIMQPIQTVLRSTVEEELTSVLNVVVHLSFASDSVAQKMLTRELLKSLKLQCAHRNPEVQRLSLLTVGNLAFCMENRHTLVASESLREFLLRLAAASAPRVYKAAARALAILGENELLRRSIRGRQVAKQGLRILSMDGGGMKGLATVRILKEIEKKTGKRIHELFDLICGTSTGGMLAVALGIKLMNLDQCEDIYKELGKLVFAEPVPKDNEAATWREKLDQLYKSSSQSFRVVVHGSKHSSDQFERLLKEMCAEDDGDLLIESAVKGIPKVFAVSTLVNTMPAQPFLFRNYQYPAGTPEVQFSFSDGPAGGTAKSGFHVGYSRSAFMGSCKHRIWQAIRASSAAPYYLDDFSDEVHRWQDGAIVGNNPTIFAIREAQLLWPDVGIDCLVSVGCGSVPVKTRKGGWRYLDTGQVLIESACSVERAEEALATLLSMVPDIRYFRFNPVDERCDMELDETDPSVWKKLEAATEEHIKSSSEALKEVCERLVLACQHDEKDVDNPKAQPLNSGDATLGWRRSVLLVEASHSPDSGRQSHHVRTLEAYFARSGTRFSLMSWLPDAARAARQNTAFLSPFMPPMFCGSFPSSPDTVPQNPDWIELVPPFCLDGVKSPPNSPLAPRPLASSVRLLHEKLHKSQAGIVHLALQNDSLGSVICWQNDVFVVAEPGELADRFLVSVKLSFLSVRNRRKDVAAITDVTTVAELVAFRPYFQIGGIIHRYIGRQTQVMEDDREIGAYMFRRTVPSSHLTADDVRWMIGAWRDRIVIYTGVYGPPLALVKAFLDSGAKAVVAPSAEPPDTPRGVEEENAKFEIGEDDAEDGGTPAAAAELPSPSSDWEDSDQERGSSSARAFGLLWDERDEQLSRFVCRFYDSLFVHGTGVQAALQHSLPPNSPITYSCHLP